MLAASLCGSRYYPHAGMQNEKYCQKLCGLWGEGCHWWGSLNLTQQFLMRGVSSKINIAKCFVFEFFFFNQGRVVETLFIH